MTDQPNRYNQIEPVWETRKDNRDRLEARSTGRCRSSLPDPWTLDQWAREAVSFDSIADELYTIYLAEGGKKADWKSMVAAMKSIERKQDNEGIEEDLVEEIPF